MTLGLGIDTKAIAALMITMGWTPETEATQLPTGVRVSFPPGQHVDIPLAMWDLLQFDLVTLSAKQ